MSKALFWDFDGTLVHTNESFLQTLDRGLRNLNYQIPADQIRIFLQTACSWYTPDETYPHRTGEQWWDTFLGKLHVFYDAHSISATDGAKISQYFKSHIPSKANYILYEDAKEVLNQCISKGYVNYIISNNYPELPAIIQDFGLAPYFADYFVSANLGYEKPRPEIFHQALKSAGYPKICYMIGDNPVADIQGAHATGMKTILVHHNHKYSEDFNCETLSEIPALLD